jgi:hypothetical protein
MDHYFATTLSSLPGIQQIIIRIPTDMASGGHTRFSINQPARQRSLFTHSMKERRITEAESDYYKKLLTNTGATFPN